MLDLLVLPEIGRLVSRGAFATKDADSCPKGAGLVCARKGAAFAVVVGPANNWGVVWKKDGYTMPVPVVA
jgi:hypothetical protein